MKLSSHELGLLMAGGVLALALFYAAVSTDDDGSMPKVQSEMQFGGVNVDIGLRSNVGTMLDLTPELHFYSAGYNCPGQEYRKSRHSYPVVVGGNISTLIHRGLDPMRRGSVDNEWRVDPPSEAVL